MWRAEAALERHDSLTVHATPARGIYEGTLAIPTLRAGRASLRLERPTALAFLGTELRLTAELRSTLIDRPTNTVGRASVVAHLERPLGSVRLVSHSIVAAAHASGTIPIQELVYFGGPTSGPGYDYHELVGALGYSQRLELQLPVPFAAVPLGRFGRAPARATLAPFAQIALVGGEHDPVRRTGLSAGLPPARQAGGYPSVGVGLLTLFDLVRFDVARGLREGRWIFSVDVSREFWRIL
jgi:hemolysin activation/secretion protein